MQGDADLDNVGMPEFRHLAHMSHPISSPQLHFRCTTGILLSTLLSWVLPYSPHLTTHGYVVNPSRVMLLRPSAPYDLQSKIHASTVSVLLEYGVQANCEPFDNEYLGVHRASRHANGPYTICFILL